MATADYVTSTGVTKHIAKLTSVLEYILQYVEGKKEELETRSIENKRLFKECYRYSSHRVECEVKKNEATVNKNQSNNAFLAPDQTEGNCISTEQLAEIELIDQVLKKADVTWRKHKPISQRVNNNEYAFYERKPILDSRKKVSFNTEDSLKNSDIGVISEAALVQALKRVNIPKAKSVSHRIPHKDVSIKNPQTVCREKEAPNLKLSFSKTSLKKGSRSERAKKDHSTKIFDKSEKNQQSSRNDLISCPKEQVKVSSKNQMSSSNDGCSTVRSCFTIPTDIKTLWRQNYSLKRKIRQLSQSSPVAGSFCSILEMELQMKSSVPCDKLQANILSRQYEDLNKLLQTLDNVCVSDISSATDILRVNVYIKHILKKTLELNKQTEILLRKAHYSAEQHLTQSDMGSVKTPHKSFISKPEIPFEFWLPPYLYQKFEHLKKLSLNLCYTSVTELNKYWQLNHQLQLNILSEHLQELFANNLVSLLTSADIPKRDRVIIFRTLQGFLWRNGQQFPILLISRGSTR